MGRCYYDKPIPEFMMDPDSNVLGELAKKHEFALEEQQRNSWMVQIKRLKQWLVGIPGTVLFEYSIPRMGKRIDCIVLSRHIVFAIEFKVGAKTYESHAIDQVLDYALDLKNFHEQSYKRVIVPVLICTEARHEDLTLNFYEDDIARPILTNGNSLARIITEACASSNALPIVASQWIDSIYKPTPTIIQAAQALYRRHRVEEISRSDADAINLSTTANAITQIIEESRKHKKKSICFLTGVPGSGKTLAGLNLANSWHDTDKAEHAVFLSGNGPLVEVLREALVRNEVEIAQEQGVPLKKKAVYPRVKSFIQNIHHFRDDALESHLAPAEHVVIFDEAQRAWTLKQTAAFMKIKKGKDDFNQSEPEFLISVMDRHADWATIICLVGGGQEINTGEAGLHEWFDSLHRSFPHWQIYISDRLTDIEYTQGRVFYEDDQAENVHILPDLHLSVAIRSFRSERVAAFVKAVLDCDSITAATLYREIKEIYPILLTRDIALAKAWLRLKGRGTERFGLVATAGAIRLKPFGINVHDSITPKYWFLNGKDDIRASYCLEGAATEFDIQGLELDWVCVAWDADLRHDGQKWGYKSFRGTNWQDIKDSNARLYLKNAYRVLLTRARQGMVIFVPHGTEEDHTRQPKFYDSTYAYLRSLGIIEVSV